MAKSLHLLSLIFAGLLFSIPSGKLASMKCMKFNNISIKAKMSNVCNTLFAKLSDYQIPRCLNVIGILAYSNIVF